MNTYQGTFQIPTEELNDFHNFPIVHQFREYYNLSATSSPLNFSLMFVLCHFAFVLWWRLCVLQSFLGGNRLNCSSEFTTLPWTLRMMECIHLKRRTFWAGSRDCRRRETQAHHTQYVFRTADMPLAEYTRSGFPWLHSSVPLRHESQACHLSQRGLHELSVSRAIFSAVFLGS